MLLSRILKIPEVIMKKIMLIIAITLLINISNTLSLSALDIHNTLQNRINPLLASTFIGSASYDDDYGPSLLIDNDGFIYLCGFTTAASFPYLNGYDSSFNGGKDIFIAKFSPDLHTLIASTFLGGSYNETEATMTFDPSQQNLYIAGYTNSQDFPVTEGAYDTSNNGGYDGYVLKIDKNLTNLQAATYFGGSANEGQQWPKLDIAVSPNGNVYLTGLTCSTDFPFITGISNDSTYAGGDIGGDSFVVKFNPDLTELLASTYLGGDANEWRMSLVVDNAENVFACGETESGDFIFTPDAYNNYFHGGSDIFICKYDSNLSTLISATSFGKSNFEEPLDIALAPDSCIFITGYTKSSNFTTTPGAYDNSFASGGRDGYIAKFNNNLTQLQACTFLGGTLRDDLTTILISDSGKVFVAGNTTSTNYPTSAYAYDSSYHGGSDYGDAVISVLDNDLTQLLASTYIGGSLDDRALDIRLDSESNILVAGYSKSSDFPFISGAYDSLNTGVTGDCFIAKFIPDLATSIVSNTPENSMPQINNLKLNNYPNPFNPETYLSFELQKTSHVKLLIYNIKGEKITTVLDTILSPGTYTRSFNASGLTSGVYFCKLITTEKSITHKILLMK